MYKTQLNMDTKNKHGYLEIITGPMYASKTTRLLEIYKQCNFCNISVAVINYAEDTRYHAELLSTHDQRMIPCIQTVNLRELWNDFNKSLLENYENNDILENIFETEEQLIHHINKLKKIYKADVILINEGQFFPDLYNVVKNMVENKKHVYICGLDGDFERKKFGQILDLIPLADKIEKLSSLCSLCKNGTRGIFSMRLTKEKTQTVIGSDNYIPVCRNCYEDNIIL